MSPRHISTTLAALTLLASSALAQATYTEVPGSVSDITPDGEIVVGTLFTGEGYYWRWKVDPAPTPIGLAYVTAVSDDGSVIVGNVRDQATNQDVGSRWTQATGWVSLGTFGGACDLSLSSARDVSGDGDVVVGLAWDNCSAYAFRWTQSTAMLQMANLDNGVNSKVNSAAAIAANGTRAVGFTQGDTSRTCAWWDQDSTGTVLDASEFGEMNGISDSGNIGLGMRNGQAFYELLDLGVPFYLGNLNPGWNGHAVDMAEDLSRIVGNDVLGLGKEAWIWTPAAGIERLSDKLTALGVAGVPTLSACRAITPNGRTIVGENILASGWIVELPLEGDVQIYGCGTNPTGSLSVLSGSAQVGQSVVLGIDNPLGTQPVGSIPLLFLSALPAPGYPCGTLLPGAGMAGGPGEVLVSITPSNLLNEILSGPAWTGPGNPAPITLPIPLNPGLVGQRIYAQGAMVDLTATTIPIAVTEAARITFGG